MNQEVRLEFNPNPAQAGFFVSGEQFLLANGGYGSGKTSCLVNKGLVCSLYYPGTVGLIGRKTYPELRDTTRREFFKWCPPGIIKKWNQTENHLVLLNNSEILFRALDDVTKIGSLNIGWFGIDELSEFTTSEVWDGAGGTHGLIHRLRHPAGPGIGFGATNPATKEHWLYKTFVEKGDAAYKVIEMPTYANSAFLPPEYIKNLEKMPPEWRDRYLQGKWGIVPKGTRVYSHFSPSVHLGSFNFNPYLPLLRSWDFGFRHPAVLFAQESTSGRMLFLKEILGTEIDIWDFRDLVVRKTNDYFPDANSIEDFCDPAGTQRSDKSRKGRTDIQILGEKGIRPKFRRSDQDQGILTLQRMLQEMRGGQPRIGIDRAGCPIFTDAMAGGYYYDEEGEPTGDDYYDHLSDCARYLVVNLYGVIERKRTHSGVITSGYPTLSEARAG